MLEIRWKIALMALYILTARAQSSTGNWTTSNSPTSLASTGSGSAYASACDSSWSSYYSASISYTPSDYTTFLSTGQENYTLTSTIYASDTCYKTCGTICYAGSHTILSTSEDPHTDVYTLLTSTASPFPTPSPTCSVGITDCTNLWSTYSAASSSWERVTITSAPSPTEPSCNTCGAVSSRCTIDPASINVFYFPVTTNTTRDYCASNPTGGTAASFPDYPTSTYVPVTTGPYGVVDGNTFYEGNVYFSIGTVSAHNPCGGAVGETRYGSILTLASSEVQSMRGYPKNNIPYSFNFGDFNTPIPYSAYFGQPDCQIRLPYCSVVYNNEYFPQIVMPAAIRQLDPAWASCSLGFFGLNDPPTAVQTAPWGDPTATSVPAEPVSTTALPTQTTAKPGNPGTSQATVPSSMSDEVPPASTPDPGDPSTSDPADPPDPPVSSDHVILTSIADPGTVVDPGTSIADPSQPPKSSPLVVTHPINANPASSAVVPNPPITAPTSITITLGSSTLIADPSTGMSISPRTTITPGAPPITLPGSTTISVGTSGVVISAPGSVQTLPFIPTTPAAVAPVITVGGTIVTAVPNPTDPANPIFVVGGTTLTPGGLTATISGTPVFIPSGGSSIVVGTQTLPFAAPVITVAGTPITAIPNPTDPADPIFVVAGTTLTPGGLTVTISGTLVFIPSGGSSIVVGTQTVPLMPLAIASAAATLKPVTLTAGDQTFVVGPTSSGTVVIAPGTTLSVGGAALTVSGTTISVGPSGVVIVAPSLTSTVALLTCVSGGESAMATKTGEDPAEITGAGGRLGRKGLVAVGIVVLVAVVVL